MTEKHVYAFGEFQLDVQQKILLREGERLPLHPKTFATLLALVESGGAVVTKDELLAKVWPDTFVEESSLTKNIALARRALRNGHDHSDYIETIPTVGYRFVADVRPHALAAQQTDDTTEETQQEKSAEDLPPLPPVPSPARRWLWSAFAFLALLLVGVVGWFWIKPSTPIQSLAVLPLNSLEPEQQDNALALRLADALILRLGSLRQLQVRPITAVRKYVGQEFDALAVGRELQAEAVLVGFLQRTDGRVRLTMRLLQTRDGQQLWADTADYQSDDALLLQDVLAGQVAQALVPQLSKEEQHRLNAQGTENAEARRLYLTGRFEWNRRTGEALKKAIGFFEEAVRLDPNYAVAWAGMADCWTILGQINDVPQTESIQKARAAITQALALDEASADVHASAALIKTHHEFDWAGAEQEFRRAIALHPNHSTIWHWYAMYLSAMARHQDALEAIQQAEKLDPTSRIIRTNHGWILWCAWRNDEALAQLQKTIEIDPSFANAHAKLGFVFEAIGKQAESVAARVRDYELSGAKQAATEMQAAYHQAGWQGYAQWELQQLQKSAATQQLNPKNFVLTYLRLGDKEQALHWLERAYAERSEAVLYLKVDPRYDALRTESRFKTLLQQMRLAD